MQINVAQQLKSAIGSVRDYEVSETVDVIGDGNGSLVQGKVSLIRTDRGILVKGKLEAEVELSCSRCLNRFNCPIILNIEEEFFPTIDMVSGASLPLPDEPGSSFTINERHELDLAEAMRQSALLAIPMKPLCREDCAGLCPGCGHNLNQGLCSCLPQGADSALIDKEKGK